MQGKVKWYNPIKGIGFIGRDGGDDIFVHHSEIVGRPINDGDNVEFEIGKSAKGPCAVGVKTIKTKKSSE